MSERLIDAETAAPTPSGPAAPTYDCGGVVGTRRETGGLDKVGPHRQEPLSPVTGGEDLRAMMRGPANPLSGEQPGSPSRVVPAVIETAGSNPARSQPTYLPDWRTSLRLKNLSVLLRWDTGFKGQRHSGRALRGVAS